MHKTVRFYKDERCGRRKGQTDIELSFKGCDEEEQIVLVPMILEIASKLGFVVPPKLTQHLEPGSTYIHWNGNGYEFVRKHQSCIDKMCEQCKKKPGKKPQTQRELILAREDARLARRIRELEEILAAVQAKEDRETAQRIGVRDRRPYHISKSKDSCVSTAIQHGDENADETVVHRRTRYAHENVQPNNHRNCKRQDCDRWDHYYSDAHGPSQHHRHENCHLPSHQHHRHHAHREYRYHEPIPLSEDYLIQEIYPPSAYRYCSRRTSRAKSYRFHQAEYDETPIVFQRITVPRRRSNAGTCRRVSRYYPPHDVGVRLESRQPEDYYY